MRAFRANMPAFLYAGLMGAVTVHYGYLAAIGAVRPAFSTWFLFFCACALGWWTYYEKNKEDFHPLNNIANLADLVTTGLISAWLLWLGLAWGVKSFDIYCLLGSAGILCWYLRGLRKDAERASWIANVAANMILTVAYFPTLRNLLTSEQNTESYAVWLTVLTAASIALFAAIKKRDRMAMLYAGRAVLLLVLVIAFMVRLEFL